MKIRYRLAALSIAVLSQVATAELSTISDAQSVASEFLRQEISLKGAWANSMDARIISVNEFSRNGQFLGYWVPVEPSGHIIVSPLREMPAIKAWSETDDFNPDLEVGYTALIKDVIEYTLQILVDRYGTLDDIPDEAFPTYNKDTWTRLLSRIPFQMDREVVGPLLSTSWRQSGVYNNLCPYGYEGNQCVVGCVATAAAQILKYWEYPENGIGTRTYWWDGDDSCPGESTPGESLAADYSDAFSWGDMLNDYEGSYSPEEEMAVAELCYEVGVAYSMDYGVCGSGAWPDSGLTTLHEHFNYSDIMSAATREDYLQEEWWGLITHEIEQLPGRPINHWIYSESADFSHMVVCDGVDYSLGGPYYYHINYGWGGTNTAWYAMDNIICGSELCTWERIYTHIEPPSIFSVTEPDFGSVWHWNEENVPVEWFGAEGAQVYLVLYKGDSVVEPLTDWIENDGSEHIANVNPQWGAGSDYRVKVVSQNRHFGWSDEFSIESNVYSIIHVPGDQPTIQAGIDAASPGDTVLVAPGVYSGLGNKNLDFTGKDISVRSAASSPTECVIDCENSGRGFHFHSGETSASVVDGFTIMNGNTTPSGNGGAFYCANNSSPSIRNCRLIENTAQTYGGGIYCDHTGIMMIDCEISDNRVVQYNSKGGGLALEGMTTVVLEGCVIYGNSAESSGGGLSLEGSTEPMSLSHCTIAGNDAPSGAGLHVDNEVVLSNVIIAYNTTSQSVYCEGLDVPVLTCCDVYGNDGGDWIGCISGQLGIDGNISSDPRFCDVEEGDLHLLANSPCLDHLDCGLVGGLGAGCDEPYVWEISADGSGEASTIQDAIEYASPGDTIALADGEYTGNRNRDLDYLGKAITIKSISDNPELCIINCEGSEGDGHRGFIFQNGESQSSVLRGVSIVNGYIEELLDPPELNAGGAVLCVGNSSPRIENCIIASNQAEWNGGGVASHNSVPLILDCLFNENHGGNSCGGFWVAGGGAEFQRCTFTENTAEYNGGGGSCDTAVFLDCIFSWNDAGDKGGGVEVGDYGTPLFTGCLFEGNTAVTKGGGINCWDGSSVSIQNCTFHGNSASFGGGIYCFDHESYGAATATIQNTIVAYSTSGGAVYCEPDSASAYLSCCDLYGNVGGDWVGFIADQYGEAGNISEDPLFCDASGGDFYLDGLSPCLPSWSPCGELIGAYDIGCGFLGTVAVDVDPAGVGDAPWVIEDPEGAQFPGMGDTTLSNMITGQYSIQWGDAYGWITPPPDTLTLDPLGSIEFVGVYSQCLVQPDGSGYYNTIQAAIDGFPQCHGDTIYLGNGEFTGPGNRDIDFLGKPIVLTSIEGRPDSCIINCQGTESEPHRGFIFQSGETSDAVIEGITIMGGFADEGGAIKCENGSSPTIRNCVLRDNYATSGGAIYSDSSSPTIENCTISYNASPTAGAAFLLYSDPIFENCILSHSIDGPAVFGYESNPLLTCTDVVWNEGGDWVKCIADQQNQNGNFSNTPAFCNPEVRDLRLQPVSPCLPEHNDCGVLVGALGEGEDCEPTGAEEVPVSERVLLYAYPNPFNPHLTIAFSLPCEAQGSLIVHDVSGRKVRLLKEGTFARGVDEIIWSGEDDQGREVASGVYFLRLVTEEHQESKKVLLLK